MESDAISEPPAEGKNTITPTPSQGLTKLDWGISFNRSSLHLSNQLRGKRFPSDQLVMFDDTLNQLSVDIQERARAAGINLIGFDFTVPQQKAFEAVLFLINASGRQRKIRIRPQDWINACQLRSYEHKKGGYRFYSQKEREEAFKALVVLAVKPFLMCYQKMDNNREVRETRIAPLWRLTLTHSAGIASPKRIEEITPEYIGKADWFEMEFEDIWFDQLDNFYLYKPRNLFERIRLSLSGPFEKIPSSLHPFLEWVFAEAARIRTKQKKAIQPGISFTLRADWHEVALQSRLHVQLEKRNYRRAQQMLARNAELAQKAGILDTYRFDGSEFLAVFNTKVFEELEAYLKGRRRQPAGSKGGKAQGSEDPPWSAKTLKPNQVRDQIADWKRERERIRENTRLKPATEAEQNQIRRLNSWIKNFESVLYGREN